MTGALVWKVYREQRLVWVVMAVLAVAVVMLRQELDPLLHRNVLAQHFCLFVYIYGLVVGAVLLAGEHEAGTAAFLGSLPARRLPVWLVKCLSGVGLVLAQVLALWAAFPFLVAVEEWESRLVLLGTLAAYGALGFAWGLFFSGWTRTSLGAIGGAFVGQVVVVPLLLWLWGPKLVPLRSLPDSSEVLTLIAFCLVQFVGLTLVSAAYQGILDHSRRVPAPDGVEDRELIVDVWEEQLGPELVPFLRKADSSGTEEPGKPTVPSWWLELAALLWLELRQARLLFLGLAVAALLAGMLPLWGLGWPLVTLVLGGIAGVSVFAGEQVQATGRFLSEQRLPLGKMWAIKVGLRLALALGVVHLLLLPAGVRASFQTLGGGKAGPWKPSQLQALSPFLQMGPYLTLGLSQGFGVGCLCGLLFRKPVIASAVAVAAALLLMVLWLPSVLVGGLHFWQYWGLPVLLLLTVRVLLWPWATGRLASREALLRLAGGLSCALLWLAGALAYRVLEVPLVEDKLDLAGLEQHLKTAPRNDAWVLVRTMHRRAGFGTLRPWAKITSQGWPALESPWLSTSLNDVFREQEARQLADVVRGPLGVFEDVPNLTPKGADASLQDVRIVLQMLVARGLQQQAQGDPVPFLDHLATGLALMRQVRYLEPTRIVSLARAAELDLLHGVERWLERLDGRPDLLSQALVLLREHEQAIVQQGNNAMRADYLVALNAVKRPELWACEALRKQHAEGELLASLVASAWRTPWEEARLQRLLRQLANDGAVTLPLPPPLTRTELFPLHDSRNRFGLPQETTQLVVRELMVALRLFQVENGRLARSLEELIPRPLTTIPIDRTTGEPFNYELVEEDEFVVPQAPRRGRPAQAPKAPSLQGTLTIKGEIFLVPLPPARLAAKEKRP
jgi:hypothetical protein